MPVSLPLGEDGGFYPLLKPSPASSNITATNLLYHFIGKKIDHRVYNNSFALINSEVGHVFIFIEYLLYFS